MSAESRYYYVDAQNQAAGPVALSGLVALKEAGTVTDATLVVVEGGTEWAAFSTLKPASTSPVPTTALAVTPQPAASTTSTAPTSPSSSTGAEPPWASQLSLKIDQLTSAMDKLVVALDKARPAAAPAPVPATAALHAEKINLNPTPKPGLAALNPGSAPRPGIATPLAPLAVPANAQKSSLPLPTLGQAPNPTSPTAPGQGNIFSKFLKK